MTPKEASRRKMTAQFAMAPEQRRTKPPIREGTEPQLLNLQQLNYDRYMSEITVITLLGFV
jgi:hypothetical protein